MKKAWTAALVLFGLCWLALAVLAFDCFPVGAANDDAGYLLVAQHFLHSGDLSTTGRDPLGTAAPYFPGQPLILAFLSVVAGGNWEIMRFLCLLITLGTAFFYFHMAAPRLEKKTAKFFAIAFLLQPFTYVFGSTFLSDMNFAFLTAGVLLLCDRLSESDAPSAATIGLVSGFTILVRISGLALAAAVVLSMVWRKQFRHAAIVVLGIALVCGPYFLLRPSGERNPYLVQIDQFSHGGTAGIFSYVASWSASATSVVGSFFLPWSAPAIALLIVLMLLAVAGARQEWRERRGSALVLFVVLYPLSLLPWPFLMERYFLCWWPLLLMCALRPLRQTHRLALLAVLLVADLYQLPAMLAISDNNRTMEADRTACYDWLRTHSPPDSIVMYPYNARVSLYAERAAVPVLMAPRMCDYLALACRQHARYLLVEPLNSAEVDVHGKAQTTLPPRLDLWLDRSSLVVPRCKNAGERLYERKVAAGRFLSAYQHYLLALGHDGRPALAMKEVDAALAQVPDFPEARDLRATLLYKQGHGDAAARLLVREIAQYPVDLEAALQLAHMLWDLGNHPAALQVLHDARARAETLSFGTYVTRIDAMTKGFR